MFCRPYQNIPNLFYQSSVSQMPNTSAQIATTGRLE